MRLSRGFSSRFAAALLALSVAAPAFAVVETPASCCCALKKARCHCPVCDHARALASGDRRFESCGAPQAAALMPSLPKVLPPSPASDAPLPLPLLPSRPVAAASEPPLPEVPTPPPLALA